MINIRPISDLRNKFTEIEELVKKDGPVYLTKNGYGTMVVMSLEDYADLTGDIEAKLLEANRAANETDKRYTLDEVIEKISEQISELRKENP